MRTTTDSLVSMATASFAKIRPIVALEKKLSERYVSIKNDVEARKVFTLTLNELLSFFSIFPFLKPDKYNPALIYVTHIAIQNNPELLKDLLSKLSSEQSPKFIDLLFSTIASTASDEEQAIHDAAVSLLGGFAKTIEILQTSFYVQEIAPGLLSPHAPFLDGPLPSLPVYSKVCGVNGNGQLPRIDSLLSLLLSKNQTLVGNSLSVLSFIFQDSECKEYIQNSDKLPSIFEHLLSFADEEILINIIFILLGLIKDNPEKAADELTASVYRKLNEHLTSKYPIVASNTAYAVSLMKNANAFTNSQKRTFERLVNAEQALPEMPTIQMLQSEDSVVAKNAFLAMHTLVSHSTTGFNLFWSTENRPIIGIILQYLNSDNPSLIPCAVNILMALIIAPVNLPIDPKIKANRKAFMTELLGTEGLFDLLLQAQGRLDITNAMSLPMVLDRLLVFYFASDDKRITDFIKESKHAVRLSYLKPSFFWVFVRSAALLLSMVNSLQQHSLQKYPNAMRLACEENPISFLDLLGLEDNAIVKNVLHHLLNCINTAANPETVKNILVQDSTAFYRLLFLLSSSDKNLKRLVVSVLYYLTVGDGSQAVKERIKKINAYENLQHCLSLLYKPTDDIYGNSLILTIVGKLQEANKESVAPSPFYRTQESHARGGPAFESSPQESGATEFDSSWVTNFSDSEASFVDLEPSSPTQQQGMGPSSLFGSAPPAPALSASVAQGSGPSSRGSDSEETFCFVYKKSPGEGDSSKKVAEVESDSSDNQEDGNTQSFGC